MGVEDCRRPMTQKNSFRSEVQQDVGRHAGHGREAGKDRSAQVEAPQLGPGSSPEMKIDVLTL